MKPTGLTWDFQIVRPNRIQDKVWDAVSEAVNAGWTPKQMVQEVWECWEAALQDKAKEANEEFRKAVKR